jgi:glycosyltransferase involved in cell wall biosynthesis
MIKENMTKVLFVSGGNRQRGINWAIKNQADSLVEEGINIDFFQIIGKGIWGYCINIFKLKRYILKNKFDIVHGHYSFSAIIASLASKRPVVASLMGSDLYLFPFFKHIVKLFAKHIWKVTIVKSEKMRSILGVSSAYVIPNGVNLTKFRPLNKKICCEKVNFSTSKKNVIFLANPNRIEKNYNLAKSAILLLNDPIVELHTVYNKPNELIPYYLNAADALILTSLHEGSPNAIKEAMACNLPIVTTDVGDVRKVLENTKGCYITSFEAEKVSACLRKCLENTKRTNGRVNINMLSSQIIAKRITAIYHEVQN